MDQQTGLINDGPRDKWSLGLLMNGYERIKAALSGEMTDRVPIMLHNFMLAAREAGFTMMEFRSSPSVIAESFIQSIETYGYDGILVDVDTVTLAGALGVPVVLPEDGPATSISGSLEDLSLIEDMGNPDISKDPRIQIWLEAVTMLSDQLGDEFFIRGNCDQAPFALASMVRGTQAWYMDLIRDPEGAHRLLNYCTIACKQFIDLMSETGAHMLSNGDSPAGPELISPDMYRTFALPYEQEIIAIAHECDLPYALHICGDTGPILNYMLESGADAYELDYRTDPGLARETFGDKASFIGNLDPVNVLALGAPETVEHAVIELLAIYGDSPRFILNAGCAIPPTTPAANIKAMIDTARNFER